MNFMYNSPMNKATVEAIRKAGIENEIHNNPVARKVFPIMYNIARFIPSFRIKKMIFKK